MAHINDCFQIGDKYYLIEDLQKIFDSRIKSYSIDELEQDE